MEIEIDRKLCSGHGRCYTLAPELFASDDEGYGVVRRPGSYLTSGQESDAERAVLNCPEMAIRLRDGNISPEE